MKRNKIFAMLLAVVMIMGLGSTSIVEAILQPKTSTRTRIDPSKTIREVEVTIKEPVVDEECSYDVTTTTTGIQEGIGVDWWYNNEEHVEPNDKYKAGGEYHIAMHLYLEEGYKWSDTVTVNVNGKSGDVLSNDDGDNEIVVFQFYELPVVVSRPVTPPTVSRPSATVISEVDVTIKEPVADEECSYDVTTTTTGIKGFDVIWSNTTIGGKVVKENEKYIAGNSYCLTVLAHLEEGYKWADIVMININGEEPERVYDAGQGAMAGVQYYMAEAPKVSKATISEVDVTIKEPVANEEVSFDVTIAEKGIKDVEVEWTNVTDGGKVVKENEKYIAGNEYAVELVIQLEEGYTIPNSLKDTVRINGKFPDSLNYDASSNILSMWQPYMVEEKTKVVDTVKISFDEPAHNKAISDKVTSKTEGIEKVTISWVNKETGLFMTDGEKYEAGSEYEARIFATVKDGYKWADEVKFNVNGKNVKATLASKDMKAVVEYEVKDTTEKSENYPWTKASEWAEEIMIDAYEGGLIPTILEEEDYTKNISRLEFASVAVKLYEKLTGTKAVPVANNPFTDTNNIEVLKAYNIGITAGVSATEFAPSNEITREQMATMMTNTLTKAGINTKRPDNVELFADDNEVSGWASNSVYYMSSVGIIKGMGENKFSPLGTATREQALTVSVNSFNKLGK